MQKNDVGVHVDVAVLNVARRNVGEEILCTETSRASP